MINNACDIVVKGHNIIIHLGANAAPHMFTWHVPDTGSEDERHPKAIWKLIFCYFALHPPMARTENIGFLCYLCACHYGKTKAHINYTTHLFFLSTENANDTKSIGTIRTESPIPPQSP